MPKCLYCVVEREVLTDEHIFPAALGGTLLLRNAVCAACNAGFSQDFENEINKRLEHFRHIFRIPDRCGKVPDIDVKIEYEGRDIDARLLGNGTLKPKPIFTVETHDGIQERVARYVTDRQMENLHKNGWEKAETTPGSEVKGSFSGVGIHQFI